MNLSNLKNLPHLKGKIDDAFIQDISDFSLSITCYKKEGEGIELDPFDIYIERVKNHFYHNKEKFQESFIHGYLVLIDTLLDEQEKN